MRKPACRFTVAQSIALLLSTTFSPAQAIDPQPRADTIKIRLIDGRNGHPIVGSYVNVWVGKERKDAMAIPTDENGVAWLRLCGDGTDTHESWKDCDFTGVINPVVKYDDSLRINVGYVLCQPHGSDYSWLKITDLPTSRVLHEGIAMTNTCGKPRVTAKPGEVIIFVRPLRWWEMLKE